MLSYTALEVDPVLGTSNHPLTLFYCRSTVISVCGFTFNEDADLTVDDHLPIAFSHFCFISGLARAKTQREKGPFGRGPRNETTGRRDGGRGGGWAGQTARRGARLISISVSEEEAVPPSLDLSTVTESVFQ